MSDHYKMAVFVSDVKLYDTFYVGFYTFYVGGLSQKRLMSLISQIADRANISTPSSIKY